MARVTQRGARTPRIDAGNTWTGTHVNWAPPAGGFVKATGMDYTLTVAGREKGSPEYTSHLTEDEMLKTISEWLAVYQRHRQQEAKKANATKT